MKWSSSKLAIAYVQFTKQTLEDADDTVHPVPQFAFRNSSRIVGWRYVANPSARRRRWP